MPSDRSLENELWDDDAKETGIITHAGCGGRIYWIYAEEFRCIGCAKQVAPEEMLHEQFDATATNQK